MLKVTPNRLNFGELALNDVPSYCRFRVENKDPCVSLMVQLAANTWPGIRFQLLDDMLTDGDAVGEATCLASDKTTTSTSPGTARTGDQVGETGFAYSSNLVAGSTSKKSTKVASGGVRQIVNPQYFTYNALFDTVNIIDHIELGPLEAKDVVAIFSADPLQFPNLTVETPPTMISGLIYLNAKALPSSLPLLSPQSMSKVETTPPFSHLETRKEGSTTLVIGRDPRKENTGGRNESFFSSFLHSPVDQEALTVPSSHCADVAAAVRSESVTLPFSAGVFLSVLTVSKTELHATMGPGKTNLLDFSVTNASSRPLPFVIRTQTMPQKHVEFAIYEVEKFEDPKLGCSLVLDSHASMNLSVMVRTTASASRHYRSVLQCDNLRDARNSVIIYVNVNVTAESQKDLVSVTDSTIDFGAVYRGTRVLRELVLSNNSREDVTVRLKESRPRQCEGWVSLVQLISAGNGSGDNNSNNSNNADTGNKNSKVTGGKTGGSSTEVDELTIPSQKGPVPITVMYVPSTDQERKGTSKLNFEIEFIMTGTATDAVGVSNSGGSSSASGSRRRQQSVVARCVATLFTSTIIASQTNVNFGDCRIGQSKRYTFSIENPSLLPTTIHVQLRSKIVVIEGIQPRALATGGRESVEEFSVAPQSNLPLTLRITPQRVNPTYRKQLTIVNASNPAEDRLIVNIEANNMAPSEAKLHDELYTCECKICTDSRIPTLRAIMNLPLIVPYSIQSRVDHPLKLQVKSSSLAIVPFFLDGILEGSKEAEEFEGLSAELHRCCRYGGDDEDGPVPLAERAEELRKQLMDALQQRMASITGFFTLEPHERRTIYLQIMRCSSGGVEVVTKEDSLSIAVEGIEGARFIRLSYKLCASRFELSGQKTKNFGEVNIGERKTTKLPIVNQSNSMLMMRLSKSRSVTADHMRIMNLDKKSIYCRIRPFATKEVELSFYPGIKGTFEERISLTNILDPTNEVVMTLKATVTKRETFDISPDSWSFGLVPVPLMQPTPHPTQSGLGNIASGIRTYPITRESVSTISSVRVGARFTVSNTSNTRRSLRIKSDVAVISNTSATGGSGGSKELTLHDRFFKFEGVGVRLNLDMELGTSTAGCSRKLEEKIEKLEQKLKIYQRKNKKDKMEAAIRQIESLKRALMGEEVDLNTGNETGSGNNNNKDNKIQEGASGNAHSGSGAEVAGVTGDNSATANATSEIVASLGTAGGGKSKATTNTSTGNSSNVNNNSMVSNTSQLTQEGPSSGAGGNSKTEQRQYYELSESEDDVVQTQKSKSRTMQHAELLPLLLRDGIPLPEMNSGESVILTLVFTVTRTTESIPATQSGTVTFLIFEAKDTETSRLIPVDITLVRVDGETDQPTVYVSGGDSLSHQIGMPSGSADPGDLASLTMTPNDPSSCNLTQKNLQLGQQVPVNAISPSSVVPKRAALPPPIAPPPVISLITLELSDGLVLMGDLMRCPVAFVHKSVTGETSEFAFNVRSDNNTSIVVLDPVRSCAMGKSALDARFKFTPRNGNVGPRDALRISVSCTPTSVGPQRYFIPVKNITHTADVQYMIIELNPTVGGDGVVQVSPREMRFADIITPCAESQLEVQSFEILSRLKSPHALLIRSNRPGQLEFFEDSECTTPLNNPVYPTFVNEKVRVYMRFRPSERFKRHTSRVMNAGVLVEAIAVIGGNSTNTASVSTLACTSPLPSPLLAPSATAAPTTGQAQPSSVSSALSTSGMGTGGAVNEIASSGGEGYAVLGQAIVRVSVLLGNGELAVEQRDMDLGTVSTQARDVRSRVRITNPSDTFTIRARLVPSLSSMIVDRREITLQPGDVLDVPVSLQLPTPGLLHEHLTLYNLSCRQDPISVYFSVLKLDEGISATLPNSVHGKEDAITIVLPTAAVVFEDGAFRLHAPVESAALHVANHTTRDLIIVAKSPCPLVMGLPQSNLPPLALDETTSTACTKTTFMTMKPTSDNITGSSTFAPPSKTEVVKGIPVTMGTPTTGTNVCPRARVRLGAQHTEAVTWTLTSMPALKFEDVARLMRHEVVTLEESAQVYVAQIVEEMGFKYSTLFVWKRSLPKVGQCVLLPKFRMYFALSEGRVEPEEVCLGVVGIKSTNTYTDMDEDDKERVSRTMSNDLPGKLSGNNSVLSGTAEEEQRPQQRISSKLSRRWIHGDTSGDRKSVAVSFSVTNLSPVLPLHLNIECEPTVRFPSNRVTVPPQQTVTLEAFLVLKLIRTQGPFRFAVFFVNALNPENDMLAYVTGQYYWKVFDLSCDGVLDGARESLSMEPLRVEEDTVTSATTVPAILSESKIVVTATESSHVELEVRTAENPKLTGIIELQTLQYDAAAPLQKIVFRSARQTGVGVHAISNTNMSGTANNTTNSGGSVGPVNKNAGSGNVGSGSGQVTTGGMGLTTNLSKCPGSGGTNAIGTNSGSINNSNSGAGSSNKMLLSLGSVSGIGNAGGSSAANNISTANTNANDNNTVGDVVVTNANVANNSNISNNNNNKNNNSANAGADSPGGSSIGNKRPREQHSLRLRCTLLRADFASLATAFFGPPSRRHRTPQELCFERSTLTFDELSDWYKRRVTASPVMWLGTLRLSTALTGDEEVQVFSTLGPFQTFRFPQRIALRPENTRSGTAVDNAVAISSVTTLYSGELIVTNPCTEHRVMLSLTAVTDRLRQPGVVFNCHCIDAEENASCYPYPKSTPHVSPSGSHNNCNTTSTTCRGEGPASDVSSRMPPPQRGGVFSGPEGESHVNESDKCTTDCSNGKNTILLSISPQSERHVQVTLRIDPNRTQPPVEQCVALALLDETVPCSAGLVRVTLAPTMTHEDGDRTRDDSTPKPSLSIGAIPTPNSATTAKSSIATTPKAGAVGGFTVGAATGGGVLAMSGSSVGVPQSHMTLAAGKAMTAASWLSSTLVKPKSHSSAVPLSHSTAIAEERPSLSIVEHWQQYHREGLSSPCVLSLHGNNCNTVVGSPGAYACSFSFTKDAPPTTDLVIRNNLPDTAVEYSVVVVSQGPQPWLLLPSASAVLRPLEGQPLRLSLLSTEVGSYVGYVSIFNNIFPGEVLLLQLSAEVFVPTAGEGLFEIITSDGQRMSSNSERIVNLGRLFGENSHTAYVALEFINRSTVPLEFTTSVVKPFRIEFNINTGEEEDDNPEDTVEDVVTVQTAPNAENEGEKDKNKDGELDIATLSLKANETVISEDSNNPLPTLDFLKPLNDSQTTKSSTVSSISKTIPQPQQQQQGLSPSSVHHGTPGKSNKPKPIDIGRPVCDARLLVCHLQSIPSLRGQKTFVVDPRSRVKVVFILVCDRLRLPSNLYASGVADVVVKCKQARDARFVFRNVFQIGRSSLEVPRQLFFLQSNDFEVEIPVRNLRTSRELCVTFRTCSPVLVVRKTEEWTSPTTAHLSFSSSSPPTLERTGEDRDHVSLRIPAGGLCTLRVRLDTSRLAALLNRSVADIAAEVPALCEHGFFLNERNPSERVGVELWYLPACDDRNEGLPGVLQQKQESYTCSRGGGVPGLLVPPSFVSPSSLPMTLASTVARPLRIGGKHISAHFIFQFVRKFWCVLSLASEMILPEFQRYSAQGGALFFSSLTSDQLEQPVSSPTITLTSESNTLLQNSSLASAAAAAGGVSEVALTELLSQEQQMDSSKKNICDTHEIHDNRSGLEVEGQSIVAARLPCYWTALHDLLVDLTWLVEELVFFSILLRNSRVIEAYSVFLTSAVLSHPLMRAWKRHKACLPNTRRFAIFGKFVELLERLPCPTLSTN